MFQLYKANDCWIGGPNMAARDAVIRAKAISEMFRDEDENMAAVAQRRMPARAYLSSVMPPPHANEQL